LAAISSVFTFSRESAEREELRPRQRRARDDRARSGISAIELDELTTRKIINLVAAMKGRDGDEAAAGWMERDAEVNRSPLRAWKRDHHRDLKYSSPA